MEQGDGEKTSKKRPLPTKKGQKYINWSRKNC